MNAMTTPTHRPDRARIRRTRSSSMCSPKLIVTIVCSSVKRSRSLGMEVNQRGRAEKDRRERRVQEETRVATASPEAGTLAGGTARGPHRDGRAERGRSYFKFTTKRAMETRGYR